MVSSSTTPPIGTLVYSLDGFELGRVEEVSDSCFKLDIQFAPDWWLNSDTVEREENGTAILRLTRAAIRDSSIHRPDAGHVGFHLHHHLP